MVRSSGATSADGDLDGGDGDGEGGGGGAAFRWRCRLWYVFNMVIFPEIHNNKFMSG